MNNNVSFLRFVAIVFIILHHILCAWGVWPPNHAIGSYIPPVLYGYVSFLLKDYGLGIFTFISGYVLFYQTTKNDNFFSFISKKIKRILIPCLIFAVIYYCIFPSYMLGSTYQYSIHGTHLWYLPMIFLCMLIVSSHIYLKYPYIYVLLSYIGLIYLDKSFTFRTFNETVYYFPIFYVGFLCHKFKMEACFNNKNYFLFLGVIIYIASIYFSSYVFTVLRHLFVFLIVSRIWNGRALNSPISLISSCSFTIYLTHQFVINTVLEFFDMSKLQYFITIPLLLFLILIIPISYNRTCFYLRSKMKNENQNDVKDIARV